MASTNTARKAQQACHACRRLKRKCSKDYPACRLCVRLKKKCEYSDLIEEHDGRPISAATTNRSESRSIIDQSSHVGLYSPLPSDTSSIAAQGPDKPFPRSFFLDTDFLTPLHSNSLSFASQPSSIRQVSLAHLELDREQLCEGYLSTVHPWLPVISRKRLMADIRRINDDDADVCLPLLLLCMKLCTDSLGQQGRDSSSHALVTSLCSTAESAGFVSLRLVQCLVLLSLYELCHAIYPAAYLTVGRAARLGILMGIHDRGRAQQLFQSAETWTLREEQRRTWWGIFVLDRILNVETIGLPFAAPEPCFDELLPVNDLDWDQGTIGGSEHLYTKSFSSSATIGSFAVVCQAAHMLGKVRQHREAKKSSEDASQLLSEAKQLHCALIALHAALEPEELEVELAQSIPAPRLIALSICTTARFMLYNLYACNEPTGSAVREPLALELQNISLTGVRSLATSTLPALAQLHLRCPLIAPCLYYAASECGWFIKEDHEPEMYTALRDIVQSLRNLELCWGVGREYLHLLEQGGILKLV